MYRHSGVGQTLIGGYLGGMDYTAISHEREGFDTRCWKAAG